MHKVGSMSENEKNNRSELLNNFKGTLIPDDELLDNLGLFMSRQNISRILFLDQLYQKIIDVHGVILEFGVRWGQDLAILQSLRGIYEPFNHNRKIIGFDTFSGFPSVNEKDGKDEIIRNGSLSVSPHYEEYLNKTLNFHEKESPISHIKKFELIKGNAETTLEQFLEKNPETVIAMAYFDFDLYEPTKKCLELIKPNLTKGSVIGFDELNHHKFPGETLALKETLGLNHFKITRSPISSGSSYVVMK